jgi:hypothetical protein
MEAWLLWSAAAVVLAVAEVLTLGLLLVPFALGALLAAFLAAIGASFSVSVAALAVVAPTLLVAVRPWALSCCRVRAGCGHELPSAPGGLAQPSSDGPPTHTWREVTSSPTGASG